LIVSYDENGGFFDHVPPPTPPAGTPGEFVYRAGRAEPIGLGFRVPCLVLSPYTRGGLVSSAVLDHTSQLRLLASRFDVPVPNLSPWRATTVGDMVSIFRGRRLSPRAVPRFAGAGPAAAEAEADDRALRARGSSGHGLDGALPPNVAPRQETEPRRRLISGP
jgi:phospholipase C